MLASCGTSGVEIWSDEYCGTRHGQDKRNDILIELSPTRRSTWSIARQEESLRRAIIIENSHVDTCSRMLDAGEAFYGMAEATDLAKPKKGKHKQIPPQKGEFCRLSY